MRLLSEEEIENIKQLLETDETSSYQLAIQLLENVELEDSLLSHLFALVVLGSNSSLQEVSNSILVRQHSLQKTVLLFLQRKAPIFASLVHQFAQKISIRKKDTYAVICQSLEHPRIDKRVVNEQIVKQFKSENLAKPSPWTERYVLERKLLSPQEFQEKYTKIRKGPFPFPDDPEPKRVLKLGADKLIQLSREYIDSVKDAQHINWRENLRLNFSDLFNFKDLEFLDCEDCEGVELTPSIQNWTKLRSLSLKGCDLKKLPQEIESWQQLEHLNIGNNQFPDFPIAIFHLPKLRILWARENQLRWVPSQISQLRRLELLNISHNKILELPEILHLLPRLVRIDAQNNQLRRLPDSFRKCQGLQSLNLSDNLLILDDLFWESITELPNLQSLKLSGLDLTHLPKSIGKLKKLRTLSVQNNPKLAELPAEILELPQLRSLYAYATDIPPKRVQQVLNTIRKRKADSDNNKDSIN